jgi:hypothetical protein
MQTTIKRIAPITLFLLISAAAQGQSVKPLQLSKLNLRVGLGSASAVIAYHIIPSNRSAKVGIRFLLRRRVGSEVPQWEAVTPETEDGPIILDLKLGQDNTGTLSIGLAKGVYTNCRIQLFNSPDGKSVDISKMVYDSENDPAAANLKLNLVVPIDRSIIIPRLVVPGDKLITPTGSNQYAVSVATEIRVPDSYSTAGGGVWAVAKGPGGISRQWASLSDTRPAEDSAATYKRIPVRFLFNGVKSSVWSMEFGVAQSSKPSEVRWTDGRLEFQVGTTWRIPAPAESLPPRVRVRNRRFETVNGEFVGFYPDMPAAQSAVRFVRGGNYGNAICWTLAPANNSPEYFKQLKALGLRFVRLNFHPDHYLEDDLYRDVVDQFVQNAWAAGLYPIISPQDFATASTEAGRVEKTVQMLKMIATRYKDKPLWYHILNEPYMFQAWAKWKPVATRLVRTIRTIDPEAFVIVPFEGWATDGRAAAEDPIREVRVDLYDGHAYVNPAEVVARFAPAIRAGLPVIIGEYGGATASYMRQMDSVLQQLSPGLMAAAPWAFTTKGQDSLALVETASADGLTFTPIGRVIADDFAEWNAGRKRP